MQFVEGKIVSGRGIGTLIVKKINLDTGDNLPIFYEGTLNIILSKPIFFNNSLAFAKVNDFFFFPITMNGVNVFVIRWKKCPAHVFEIVSSHDLNRQIEINTGAAVSIYVNDSILCNNCYIKKSLWFLLWEGRKHLYYSDNYYQLIINRIYNLYFIFLNRLQKIFIFKQ